MIKDDSDNINDAHSDNNYIMIKDDSDDIDENKL
jgi:hypothetical protein